MSRSLVMDSTIKLIRFQLDDPRRGSCEGRQSVDPVACNILIMRRCVGRIARDATEKLYAIKVAAIYQVEHRGCCQCRRCLYGCA